VTTINASIGGANPPLDVTAERQPGEPSPVFDQIPHPPDSFMGRSEMVEALCARLRHEPVVALCGIAGIGKSTLAARLAHHPALRAHFADGVLWATLGPQADPIIELERWASALGIDLSRLPNADQRAQALHDAIGSRRMLLVVDDAWSLETATFLRCGGPNCGYLLTTRNKALAIAFAGAAQTVIVPTLSDVAAHELLCGLASDLCAIDPFKAKALSAAVDGLPLALVLVGVYLAAP
jgi:hypothetical protein